MATVDKDTQAVFGDYVSVYDIEQAVKDGATVPIYYASRLAKLDLNPEQTLTIDDEVDELTEDEEDTVQACTKSRWAALEKLVGAQPRIDKIAADLVKHYETAFALLPIALNHVLGLEEGKRRFSDCVLTISQSFALCCTLDDALGYRDEIAFFQATRNVMGKGDPRQSLNDEAKEHALRQIISKAVMSGEVIDIFSAAGLKRPDVSILSDAFLEDVRRMKEKNLAVELLERLLRGDIQSRFATNVVQKLKFSESPHNSLTRHGARGIETAQVIEELIAMAKQFQHAAERGEQLGLKPEEMAFYDDLATSEASVRILGDAVLRKIVLELTEKLRNSVRVDWSVRESVRARLRMMVRTIPTKYRYPPDQQEEATDLVLKQAETLSAVWA